MKLIPIDITKADKHECPGVKTDGTEYLCVINGKCFAGTFNRQHYGLNFRGWYYGLQFDAPGTNASSWQAIYEIQHDYKPIPPKPRDLYCDFCCSKMRTAEGEWVNDHYKDGKSRVRCPFA